MKLLTALGTGLVVLGLAVGAEALQVDLAWTYTDAPGLPAKGFVMQACEVVPPATGCTNFADLPTAIPATARTFTDSTVVLNKAYCYQVVAVSDSIRSEPSNVACAGKFMLNAPGSLSATIR